MSILNMLRGGVDTAARAKSAGQQAEMQTLPLMVQLKQMAEQKAQQQAESTLRARLTEAQIRNYDSEAQTRGQPKTSDPYNGRTREQYLADERELADIRTDHRAPPKQHLQPLQGPKGYVSFDPETGKTSTINDPDGNPLQTKEQASVRQKVAENQTTLSAISKAMQLLKQHPTAVGLRRMLTPDALSQFTDKPGVDTRAAIANIGSLKIHERTGAAMSPKEWKRLAGFIPTENDQSDAAMKKLQQMYDLLKEETDFLGSEGSAPAAPVDRPVTAGSPFSDLIPKKP